MKQRYGCQEKAATPTMHSVALLIGVLSPIIPWSRMPQYILKFGNILDVYLIFC
jgi:hypothetical protein